MDYGVVQVFYCSWGPALWRRKSPESKTWMVSSGLLSSLSLSVLSNRQQGNPHPRGEELAQSCYAVAGIASDLPWPHARRWLKPWPSACRIAGMRCAEGSVHTAQLGCVDCRGQTYVCGFLHYLLTSCSSFPMTCSRSVWKVITIPKWAHKNKPLH